jgi:hypothetical protein
MNGDRLREYRGIVGVQLQFEERGDTHKVMEMQHELEKWVALQIQSDILLAWEGMKAHQMHAVNCSLTVEEIKAYRMLVAEAMKIYADSGFVPWSQQQERIELFVQGAIDKHVLDATRTSITLRQN